MNVNVHTNYEEPVKQSQPRCPYCKSFLPRSPNSRITLTDWSLTNETGVIHTYEKDVFECKRCGGIWQYKDIYKHA
jgi:hypothetical protein